MAPRLNKTTPVDKKRPKPRARKPKTKTIETTGETVIDPPGGPMLGQFDPPPPPATIHVPAAPAMSTNGAHVNGATPATNGHTNGHVEAYTPESIEAVAAAVLDASRTGDPAAAHALGKQLPSGAAGDVVGWCLPEAWRDAAAAALLQKLGDDDAALVLSWLTCQWWEGYNVGHLHGVTGEDLRS